MAHISLVIDKYAKIRMDYSASNPYIGIEISVDIPSVKEGRGKGGPIPYARDKIVLHGNRDEIRAFAESLIKAVSR